MKDYKGSANHANALADFLDEVVATLHRDDIDNDRRVEIINDLTYGPHGLKIASQVREESKG
ncbi:hypothetical protein AH02_64 [Pseudomonas phage AH02]|nr:hypothetical protein AH02_64 [Pseudomonas phage AH02]